MIRQFLRLIMPRLFWGVCSTAPGETNTGAWLWDMGAQGSDHTTQPGQPIQAYTNPENIVFADAGVWCSDMNGQLYMKTTDRTLCTGWCQIVCIPQGVR